eukprot:s4114_g8.t1
MSPELIEPVVLQLQAAIEILHCQARLLHLDIKPANILWCPHQKVLKLCDFGMAEPVSMVHAQAQPRFCEYVTPGYRPPELWHVGAESHALRAALTKAVDVWSFGCVVFEIATGKTLMYPKDRRQVSSRQTVADWCKNWPEMSSSPRLRQGLPTSKYWHCRLSACGMWHAAVLAA